MLLKIYYIFLMHRINSNETVILEIREKIRKNILFKKFLYNKRKIILIFIIKFYIIESINSFSFNTFRQ